MKVKRLLFFCILLFASFTWAANQDLYVSSSGTNSVKRFDGITGAYLGDFVAAGSGGLNNPQGLTFGPDGNLYVSSVASGQVLRFDGATGAFIGVFTLGPAMTFPSDMDWHGSSLYVSDGGSSVNRYDATTGVFQGVFTSVAVPGPDGLSWDPSGNLYVSSFGTNSVKKFSPTGTYIGDFVAAGNVSRALDSRFGDDGNLYVNSFNTGRVKRFDGLTGAFISDFVTGLGTTQGQTIGPDGNLYVGSYNGSFIKKFNPVTGADLGTFASGGGLLRPNNFAFAPLHGAVRTLTCSPAAVPSGTNSTGTVTLWAAAPVGGITVNLSSNNAAAVVPSTVTVLAGATTATFSITTSNATYAAINAAITQSYGTESNHTAVLTVRPSNYAAFIGQTVPASMTAGQSYAVSLQFKNTGLLTWDTAHGYKLESANPYNNTTWGMNRLALTSGPVAPGATGTFSGTVIAPANTATYNFQWQMVEEGVSTFGAFSTNLAIPVTKVADAARFISKTGPTTVNAGADFTATFTMMNVGTNTWTTAAYSLRPIYDNWNASSIPLPSDTAPNAQKGFSRILTAPITPGTYSYQWQMYKASFFGDKTPFMSIVVTLGADDAQFMSETTISNSIAPNATFGATFTMKNLGTATWGAGYNLVPIGSNNFGVASIASGAVSQNNSGPFTATFTAPSTPGTYTFQMRMSHSGTKFGTPSTLHTIVVSADAAQYLSRTGPNTVNAGADFFVQNTMKNTGSTSWTGAAGYYMMSQTPANNTTWTINKLFLPGAGPFGPGSSVTFTGKCTAPITPATYTMQWQMSKSGVAFGEKSPLINIVVTAGPDNAQFVSQTGVPTTIVHGTTFNATITMKNIGSATWDGTYSLASVGSNTFGIASIVATSTAPNANKAFTATFTAPATPGTYTFQMRMQHTSTRFGQPATLATITVT